jgi:hypothetical protein
MLTLKTPYRDGMTPIVMSPLEFMQRLAALVPRPRLHLIRFHGVLAPNARLRAEIITSAPVNANNTADGHCNAPPSLCTVFPAVWRNENRFNHSLDHRSSPVMACLLRCSQRMNNVKPRGAHGREKPADQSHDKRKTQRGRGDRRRQ